MDGTLFSWFYNIWKTEVEVHLKGSTLSNYKWKYEWRNFICINTAALANNLKTKTKTPRRFNSLMITQIFPGIDFSKHTYCSFNIGKYSILKSVNMKKISN